MDFVSCVICQRYKRHYACEKLFYVAFHIRWTYVFVYSYICFRPDNHAPGMKSDEVIVSPVGFDICMYHFL